MMDIISELEKYRETESLSLLEVEFVRFLTKIDPNAHADVFKAAAACVHAQKNGNVCLDLDHWNETYVFGDAEIGEMITDNLKEQWLVALRKSSLVSDGSVLTPLVLEGNRLYLHRFWKYEEELSAWMREKSAVEQTISAKEKEVIRQLLSPSSDLFETNWQHVAICLSFLKDLLVISGGPGTGKTFTVLNVIAAQMKVNEGKKYRIALAAPTGKAARKLMDSIHKGQETLPESFRASIDIPDAQTVHKLLGADFRGRNFKYNADNKLPYDLVIVDEASMLDITMWVRLIRATGPKSKLVVLGDKDQLASVEAGSILGDLCGGFNSYSKNISSNLAEILGMQVPISEEKAAINDSVVFLTKSYRFGRNSGIYQFAQAVNDADVERAMNILQDKHYSDIQWLPASGESIQKVIQDYAVEHYRSYSELEVYDRLQIANTKKILCALRKSEWGVQKINQRSERLIKRCKKLLDSNEWYDGRIIMATRNDSTLKIRNGEIGIYEEKENPKVRFEGDEQVKVSSSRLKDYEPAYAITIHKSQGSEFNDVAIVLPSRENSILSKEILYTAVTRARQNTLIIARKEILRKTIENSVSRSSGVKQKVWGN